MSKEKRLFDVGIMSEARPSESLLLRQKIKGSGNIQFQHIPDKLLDDFKEAVEKMTVTDGVPKKMLARQAFIDPLSWRKPNTEKIMVH